MLPSKAHLSYTATATNASPAQLSAAMAAVPLYTSPTNDPVLKDLFGCTVDSDSQTLSGPSVTRTVVVDLSPAFFSLFPTVTAWEHAFDGLYQLTIAKFLSTLITSNVVTFT